MIYAYSGNRLFQSYAPFDSENLGALPDALECTVARDVEGLFELSMTYPLQGRNAEALRANNWLFCDAGGTQGMAYFRIDQVFQDISGTLSIHACHASYNALKMVAAPFSSKSSGSYTGTTFYSWLDALYGAVDKIDPKQRGGFSIVGYTDQMVLNSCRYQQPVTVKQAVLDAINGLENLYLDYDAFGFRLWEYQSPASDPQFRIRYGRDMLGFQSSVDATEFYTHIYPYYMVEDQLKDYRGEVFPLQNLPERYQSLRLVKAVNMADYYGGLESIGDDVFFLNFVIKPWLQTHPWNPFPDEVSVESLPQEGNAFELGNLGKLYYTLLGITMTASIVSLTYDVLSGRMTSIGINRRRKDVTDTIAELVAR